MRCITSQVTVNGVTCIGGVKGGWIQNVHIVLYAWVLYILSSSVMLPS